MFDVGLQPPKLRHNPIYYLLMWLTGRAVYKEEKMRVLRFALEGDQQEGSENLPIISVDFDATVHSYEWGWQDGTIYGTVLPGFFEWLMSAYTKFKVVIFSTRSAETDKLEDMKRWLEEQYLMWRHSPAYAEWLDDGHGDAEVPEAIPVEFSADKPKAHASIDDRAIRFEGKWDAEELQPEALAAFKPWNER